MIRAEINEIKKWLFEKINNTATPLTRRKKD